MSNPIPLREKFEQIADYYQALINGGQIMPGHKVPSVDDIAITFDVARNTAWAAIRELKRRNLVYTEQGRGTFALPRAA